MDSSATLALSASATDVRQLRPCRPFRARIYLRYTFSPATAFRGIAGARLPQCHVFVSGNPIYLVTVLLRYFFRLDCDLLVDQPQARAGRCYGALRPAMQAMPPHRGYTSDIRLDEQLDLCAQRRS